MTYAGLSEEAGCGGHLVDKVPTTDTPTGGHFVGEVPSVRTTTGRASEIMKSRRSAGYEGSRGRYAPLAFNTASKETTRSTERSSRTPTTRSGPTPNPTNSP